MVGLGKLWACCNLLSYWRFSAHCVDGIGQTDRAFLRFDFGPRLENLLLARRLDGFGQMPARVGKMRLLENGKGGV